jgi:hypothetical protein
VKALMVNQRDELETLNWVSNNRMEFRSNSTKDPLLSVRLEFTRRKSNLLDRITSNLIRCYGENAHDTGIVTIHGFANE